MKFTYKIEASDFLEFQLFNASHDPIIQKRKKKGWLFFTIVSIFLAIFSILNNTPILAVYFAMLAIVIGVFYPNYFSWRYKKQYAYFISRNYAKLFGEQAEIEITNEYILSKDVINTTKVKLDEIASIHETTNHFFMKTSSGMSFIFPKHELKEPSDVSSKFQEIGVKVLDQLHWKW